MPALQRLLAPLDAYPHWLVATCAVVTAILAVWLLVKLLKWTLYLMLVALIVTALAALVALAIRSWV